jgi:hypothetical protein
MVFNATFNIVGPGSKELIFLLLEIFNGGMFRKENRFGPIKLV